MPSAFVAGDRTEAAPQDMSTASISHADDVPYFEDHMSTEMDQDRPNIRVSSPEIAAQIRPIPVQRNALSLGARKKHSLSKMQSDTNLNDISSLLQVLPIPMKPKEDGSLAKSRLQEKENMPKPNILRKPRMA